MPKRISPERLSKIQSRVEAQVQENIHPELNADLAGLDFHDIAKIIKRSEYRVDILTMLPADIQAEVFFLLSNRIRRELCAKLTRGEIEAILHFMDETEAERIVPYLSSETTVGLKQDRELDHKEEITELMQALPETAGELVEMNYITVREEFTVRDVAKKLDEYLVKHTNEIPVIIATNVKGEVLGRVYLALLITASEDVLVADIIRPVPIVDDHVDQEVLIDVLRESKKDDLIVATDEDKRLIGVIHARNLLHVIEEEATEDLYGFAGVHREEKAVESPGQAVLYRYRWLILNLFTAFLAASVVSLFKETLTQMVILAVYMPIVAGMGGNAGTQTLAVVVRGLALGEIEKGVGKKVLLKEATAGVLNGLIIGAIVSVVATLWHGNPMLGLVLAIAMIINLFAAGLFGTLVPITLRRLNLDPAISSSVFLTTATDIIGFFTFLGLATWVLL